jgi:hypothetical protein
MGGASVINSLTPFTASIHTAINRLFSFPVHVSIPTVIDKLLPFTAIIHTAIHRLLLFTA